jgi:hypothetical protein
MRAGATYHAEETATATSERRAAHAGSGRKKGTLNRRTVELRALMAALLNDVDYQNRLRDDFRKRRVQPSTEALASSASPRTR